MKIAVIGAGGVGGFYGGLLAKSGEEVAFLGRGEHLNAIKDRGLTVKSPMGEFLVRPKASDSPNQLGPVDLVVFAVKTYDTEKALDSLLALCRKDTVVVSFQNGVDSAERIAQVVGADKLIGGLTYVESRIEQPGVIAQTSKFHRVIIGELDGSNTERLTRIHSSFTRAGINCETSTDIRRALWQKLLFLCAFASITSVTRSSIGEVLQFTPTRDLVARAMGEIVEVAISQGVNLGAQDIQNAMKTAEGFEFTTRTSMQRDIENDRPSEVDSLTGKVAELGKQAGIATPTHDFVYASLKVQHLRNLKKHG